VDGGDDVVADSLAELRKGTVDFFLHRAPLDAGLHQENEGDEALLLGPSVGSGMVGNGGALGWPTARVSVTVTKMEKIGALGLLPRIYTVPGDRRWTRKST
jgi:hypothetical protein